MQWQKKVNNFFGFNCLPFFVIALKSFSYNLFTFHVVKNLKEGSSDLIGKVVKFVLPSKDRVSNVKNESGVILGEEISKVEDWSVCSIFFLELSFEVIDGL